MDLLVISISILIAGGRTCPGPLQEAEAAENRLAPGGFLLGSHLPSGFY